MDALFKISTSARIDYLLECDPVANSILGFHSVSCRAHETLCVEVLLEDAEEHLDAVPIVQEAEITVPAVGHHDAVRWVLHLTCRGVVGSFLVDDVHVFRKESGEIEQCVKIHRTLGIGVQRPVVYLHAEGHKGGVKLFGGHLLPAYAPPPPHLLSQMRQNCVIDVVEHVTAMSLVSENILTE